MGKGTVEIERKFLVKKDSFPALMLTLPQGSNIRQGYLSREPVVRIRIADTAAFLTVKGPGKMTRREFEYGIPLEDAEHMLTLSQRVLTKTRYIIPYEGKLWEVDEFKGSLQGLWLAELELTTEEESFSMPPWAGREVTLEKQFTNASLSTFSHLMARTFVERSWLR